MTNHLRRLMFRCQLAKALGEGEPDNATKFKCYIFDILLRDEPECIFRPIMIMRGLSIN